MRRPRGLGAWAGAVALLVATAAVAATYVWFISVGFTPKTLPDKGYHDRLAESFLHGQLHTLEGPSAELLAQEDPYDFKTSRHLWRTWDASLYDGKYYFYWGPVPALIISAVKLVGGADTVVTDRQLVLVFQLGRLLVGAALLVLVLHWLSPTTSPWMLSPAVLLWGLVNPYLYELGRPAVYEAAIDSAQFFVLLGLLAAFAAVRGCRTRVRERLLLAAAGASWALAIGCRVSLLFAVLALIALAVLAGMLSVPARTPARGKLREILVRACVLSAPLALMLLALGLYNYARFGSFLDFGTDYMLTGRRYSPTASFFLPNLHSYLLRRYTVSCEFPFLGAPYFARDLTPGWVTRESGWVPQEPLVGLFVGIPGLLFAVAAVVAAVSCAIRLGRSSHATSADGLYAWLVASCGAIWLLAGLPALGVWFSTMRYLSDVTSSALLMAILGFWTLAAYVKQRGARFATAALHVIAAMLVLYSVTVGVALGFQGGYHRAFRAHNRPLYLKLTADYSLCEPEPAAVPAPARRGR